MDANSEANRKVKETTSVQDTGAGSELPEAPACRHQWMIDAPAGPSSKGVCRVCGEERHFLNYIEGSPWGNDISLEQLSGGSRYPTGGAQRAKKGLAEDEISAPDPLKLPLTQRHGFAQMWP